MKKLTLTSVLLAAAFTASAADYTLPFNIAPNDEQWAQCTILDANGDADPNDGGLNKGVWSLVNGQEMMYKYNSNNKADDWVFLPACDFGDAEIVNLSLQAKVSMPSYPESFEVYYGTAATPEAMTTMVMQQENIYPGSYTTYSAEFNVEPGTYVIGIHATSAKDSGDLFIKNISVVKVEKAEPVTYTLPFYMLPTEPEFNSGTIIDANTDNNTWKYDADREAMVYHWNIADSSKGGDDWFITPEIDFGNTDKIKLSYQTWAAAGGFNELVEFYLGTEPTVEAMTNKIGSTAVTNSNPETFTSEAEVTPGKYYLGIKAASEADQYIFYVNNINIESLHEVETGVAAIEFDNNLPVEYYNMNGVRVANPEKGSIVIARQGNKVVKMIVR